MPLLFRSWRRFSCRSPAAATTYEDGPGKALRQSPEREGAAQPGGRRARPRRDHVPGRRGAGPPRNRDCADRHPRRACGRRAATHRRGREHDRAAGQPLRVRGLRGDRRHLPLHLSPRSRRLMRDLVDPRLPAQGSSAPTPIRARSPSSTPRSTTAATAERALHLHGDRRGRLPGLGLPACSSATCTTGTAATRSRAAPSATRSTTTGSRARFHLLELIGPDPAGGCAAGPARGLRRRRQRAAHHHSSPSCASAATGRARAVAATGSSQHLPERRRGGGAAFRCSTRCRASRCTTTSSTASPAAAVNLLRDLEAEWEGDRSSAGSGNWVTSGSTNVPPEWPAPSQVPIPGSGRDCARPESRPRGPDPKRGPRSTQSPAGQISVLLWLPEWTPPQGAFVTPGGDLTALRRPPGHGRFEYGVHATSPAAGGPGGGTASQDRVAPIARGIRIVHTRGGLALRFRLPEPARLSGVLRRGVRRVKRLHRGRLARACGAFALAA